MDENLAWLTQKLKNQKVIKKWQPSISTSTPLSPFLAKFWYPPKWLNFFLGGGEVPTMDCFRWRSLWKKSNYIFTYYHSVWNFCVCISQRTSQLPQSNCTKSFFSASFCQESVCLNCGCRMSWNIGFCQMTYGLVNVLGPIDQNCSIAFHINQSLFLAKSWSFIPRKLQKIHWIHSRYLILLYVLSTTPDSFFWILKFKKWDRSDILS